MQSQSPCTPELRSLTSSAVAAGGRRVAASSHTARSRVASPRRPRGVAPPARPCGFAVGAGPRRSRPAFVSRVAASRRLDRRRASRRARRRRLPRAGPPAGGRCARRARLPALRRAVGGAPAALLSPRSPRTTLQHPHAPGARPRRLRRSTCVPRPLSRLRSWAPRARGRGGARLRSAPGVVSGAPRGRPAVPALGAPVVAPARSRRWSAPTRLWSPLGVCPAVVPRRRLRCPARAFVPPRRGARLSFPSPRVVYFAPPLPCAGSRHPLSDPGGKVRLERKAPRLARWQRVHQHSRVEDRARVERGLRCA